MFLVLKLKDKKTANNSKYNKVTKNIKSKI